MVERENSKGSLENKMLKTTNNRNKERPQIFRFLLPRVRKNYDFVNPPIVNLITKDDLNIKSPFVINKDSVVEPQLG